jgi:hypothetical protein
MSQEQHCLPPQVLAQGMEQETSHGLLQLTAPSVEEIDAVLCYEVEW